MSLRILLLFLSYPIFYSFLNAQSIPNNGEHSHSFRCGTADKDKKQREYSLEHIKALSTFRNSGTTCIGIAVHVVRMDDGTGGLGLDTLAKGIANLNYNFLDAGIEFYVCSIDYVNDSDYYEFNEQTPDSDTESDLAALFTESTDAANLYVVNSITDDVGNTASGYAYFPCNTMTCTRVVMKNSTISSATNAIFSHEFGHFFDLEHTHAGTSDGPFSPNAERVVRTGANANCDTNGDTFCDTDADPRYASGNFDSGSCTYTGTATDDLGVTYLPTTAINNIMSYYPNSCGGIFTSEQYTHLAAGLTERLGHTVYDIDGCTPDIVAAASDLTGSQQGGTSINLTWTDNANNELGYLIERSTTSSSSGFKALPFGGTANNVTSFSDTDIATNTTYWYRIKALNGDCNTYSNVFEITTELAYCSASYAAPCASSIIDDFTFYGEDTDDISNLATGCSGDSYSDYTDTHSATVIPGNTYSFTICRSGANTRYAEVWVDFNHDGDFDDSGETIIDASVVPSPCYTGSMTIPYCTAFGPTTMRIILVNGSQPTDPCGSYIWGEVEDYTLDIRPDLLLNSGAITTGIADYSCMDGQGWVHYWDNVDGTNGGTDDVLLLSLSPGSSGLSISPSDVSVRLEINESNYYEDGTGFMNPGLGNYGVMFGRTFDVDYNGSLNSDVGVRFYYPTSEYDDVNTTILAAPILGTALASHSELIFYKVTSNDDPWDIANIESSEVILIYNGASPSTTTWTHTNYGPDFNMGEYEVSSFSGGGAGGNSNGTTLPVELIRFNGNILENTAHLFWQTSSEKNNAYFNIEHSSNGIDYTVIGKKDGQGNSSTTSNYYFIHKTLSLGINYYRLVQYDYDGKSNKHGVISLNYENNKKIDIFPVPARPDKLNISYHTIEMGKLQWEVFNMHGQSMVSGFADVLPGMNVMPINAHELKPSIYYLKITQGEFSHTMKFIISEKK